MGNIDTVLFDFDGTVMDTNNVIIMSWQHTFRTLENREEKEETLLATFGEPLETTIKKFFPDVPVSEAVDIYRSYHYDNFGELINVFPGVRELLEEIQEKGYKTGLVTSRLLKTTLQGLEAYGLTDLFDVIVTADDTTKHKPDPEPINVALKKLGAAPDSAIMLGDTVYDLECAKNAGVRSVLVAWSAALDGDTAAGLGDSAPDYIISKPGELLDIIENSVE